MRILKQQGRGSGGTARSRAWRSGGLALASLLFSAPAFCAWDFVPTPTEYQAWPEYCRVQFTLFGDTFAVPNAIHYSQATVDEWRRRIGEPFLGLHHYCASMHFLSRSRVETDRNRKRSILHRALSDALYSYARADPASIVYPNMAVTVARIKLEMGAPEEAVDILQNAIKRQPARGEPYMMLALIHRKQHKLDLALDVLRDADQATGGDSAEIQYNLGLINLERGDVDAAVINAREAYASGYPLPGLKDKLAKIGRWDEAVQ